MDGKKKLACIEAELDRLREENSRLREELMAAECKLKIKEESLSAMSKGRDDLLAAYEKMELAHSEAMENVAEDQMRLNDGIQAVEHIQEKYKQRMERLISMLMDQIGKGAS